MSHSSDLLSKNKLALLSERATRGLPGYMGIEIVDLAAGFLIARMKVCDHHLATNGYLHAGSVVTLADTSCGFGCIANLPEDGLNFTTVELKSNFMRSTTGGSIRSEAKLVHAGRRTQVWDATVLDDSDRMLALFRCTQMILY